MTRRTCSGCGAEMGDHDTYCRVCGRIQLPLGARGPLGQEPIGCRAMLLWAVILFVVLAIVAALLMMLDRVLQ